MVQTLEKEKGAVSDLIVIQVTDWLFAVTWTARAGELRKGRFSYCLPNII